MNVVRTDCGYTAQLPGGEYKLTESEAEELHHLLGQMLPHVDPHTAFVQRIHNAMAVRD